MRRGCAWFLSIFAMTFTGFTLAGCDGDNNSGGGGGQVTNVSKTNAGAGATSEEGDDSAVTGSERPAQGGETSGPRTTGTTGGGASGKNEQ